jgi:hypothetical protein
MPPVQKISGVAGLAGGGGHVRQSAIVKVYGIIVILTLRTGVSCMNGMLFIVWNSNRAGSLDRRGIKMK